MYVCVLFIYICESDCGKTRCRATDESPFETKLASWLQERVVKGGRKVKFSYQFFCQQPSQLLIFSNFELQFALFEILPMLGGYQKEEHKHTPPPSGYPASP